MTHNKQKNQSMGADRELTRMLGLVDKNAQTVIVTAFHMFKKLTRDVEDI